MATNTSINALFEAVTSDLLPFYDNAVLLPNPGVITNIFNISGSTGNTIRMPKTNQYGTANVSIGDNTPIIQSSEGLGHDLEINQAGSVTVEAVKRGAGTLVSMESIEDGGADTVQNAVVTRLSRSLAQSTDIAGLRVAAGAAGTEAAIEDVVGLHNNSGYSNVELAGETVDTALVMSPEALGYVIKRDPVVKMFEDVDSDNIQMVSTVRNGFARAYGEFVRTVATSTLGGDADLQITLDQIATAVAQLRAQNAPTDAQGFYVAVISPAQELALAKAIAGVSSTTGTVGDLSTVGNQILIDSTIGLAVGCRFIRSNNLPQFPQE